MIAGSAPATSRTNRLDDLREYPHRSRYSTILGSPATFQSIPKSASDVSRARSPECYPQVQLPWPHCDDDPNSTQGLSFGPVITLEMQVQPQRPYVARALNYASGAFLKYSHDVAEARPVWSIEPKERRMADYLTRARQDRKNQDNYIREEERAKADQRVAAAELAAEQRLAAEREKIAKETLTRHVQSARITGMADIAIADLLGVSESEVAAIPK